MSPSLRHLLRPRYTRMSLRNITTRLYVNVYRRDLYKEYVARGMVDFRINDL